MTDLSILVLSYPKGPFGPREPRVAAVARRRDRCEHTPRFWINLLDLTLIELIQVLSVESRSSMRGNIDRVNGVPARRIECHELVVGSNPGVFAVKCDPIDTVDA